MTYETKKRLAKKEMLALANSKDKISLKAKSTSHFFRHRKKKVTIDLKIFNEVIKVDTQEKVAEVEGLTKFWDLTAETLKHGLIPEVVPDLRAITVGGAISGLGLESSSFKYGMVHEVVTEFDLLTSSGEVVTCSKTKHPDLFITVPNSLGTLGYILKCKIKLRPGKKYVRVEVERYTNVDEYFGRLKELITSDLDFLDGVMFKDNFLLVKGNMEDELPYATSVTNLQMNAYYQLLENKDTEVIYLTIWDYLWRWDYDSFWGTKRKSEFFTALLQNKLFRLTLGRFFLRSDTLLKIRHFIDNLRYKTKKIEPNEKQEDITQDVGVQLKNSVKFVEWFQKEIKVNPIWVCPVNLKTYYPLIHSNDKVVLDLGFYTSKEHKSSMPQNYYNNKIEDELMKLKATKGLHAQAFYTEDEFWSMFNKTKYFEVKEKYDPGKKFPDLYSKVVGETKS